MEWAGPLIISASCDSDHASIIMSPDKRSMNGMVISVFGFILGVSPKTQPTVAPSSGEAETFALSSAMHDGCSIKSILTGLGVCQRIFIHLMIDATTANWYADRFGSGPKARHVNIIYMAIQEFVSAGIPMVLRTEGTHNPDDLLTEL